MSLVAKIQFIYGKKPKLSFKSSCFGSSLQSYSMRAWIVQSMERFSNNCNLKICANLKYISIRCFLKQTSLELFTEIKFLKIIYTIIILDRKDKAERNNDLEMKAIEVNKYIFKIIGKNRSVEYFIEQYPKFLFEMHQSLVFIWHFLLFQFIQLRHNLIF